MLNRFKHIRRDFNQWSLYLVLLVLIIGIPVFSILIYLFYGIGEMWEHIVTHYLFDFIFNSAILVIGTVFLTFVFGTYSAWIVSQYEFPFRKWIEKVLFLPLAIPSYIVAYTYIGLFDNDGTLIQAFQMAGFAIQKLDFMNIYGLIWVLSISLFPYVYASTRVMFLSLPKSIYESSMLLGASRRRYFFSVALPLAAPAIIGGLFLVVMEVLNDYGAAKYFGVHTFTTGIFRSWTMLEDLQSAIYLSALLVLLVFLIMYLVIKQRGRKSFAIKGNHAQQNQTPRQPLKGSAKIIHFFGLLVPILFGFLLPVFQLLKWAVHTYDSMLNIELLWLAGQSFLVGIVTATFTIIAALMLIYFSRWNPLSKITFLKRFATVGYVIPGAIIGIGIIRSSQSIVNFFSNTFEVNVGYLFYGSSFILIYAYMFRFLSVAFNPLEANSLKIGKHLSESSFLLGAGKWRTLFQIEIPLFKKAIASAFILVFIDVLKELPLTLILKPYNLNTLAISAYAYASDERVAEAAIPSLTLIFIIVVLMSVFKTNEQNE